MNHLNSRDAIILTKEYIKINGLKDKKLNKQAIDHIIYRSLSKDGLYAETFKLIISLKHNVNVEQKRHFINLCCKFGKWKIAYQVLQYFHDLTLISPQSKKNAFLTYCISENWTKAEEYCCLTMKSIATKLMINIYSKNINHNGHRKLVKSKLLIQSDIIKLIGKNMSNKDNLSNPKESVNDLNKQMKINSYQFLNVRKFRMYTFLVEGIIAPPIDVIIKQYKNSTSKTETIHHEKWFDLLSNLKVDYLSETMMKKINKEIHQMKKMCRKYQYQNIIKK